MPNTHLRRTYSDEARLAWLSTKSISRILWKLLCTFIVIGSFGHWALYQPAIWAPTLVVMRDVVINIVLYVPFGALGVLSLRDGDVRHWTRLVLTVVALAVLFSAANETLQLYTSDRVASLTDIGSAAIGALCGAAAVAAVWPR